MSGDVMLDPRLIRFTHSRIRPLFSCGRRVEDTLESLRSGTIKMADLPRITVIEVSTMRVSDSVHGAALLLP